MKTERLSSDNVGVFKPMPSTRLEITDPLEIQKKLNAAVRKLIVFLGRKIARGGNVLFEITFNNMLSTLELSDIVPRSLAIEKCHNMIRSVPGMEITDTTYRVSNPVLFKKKFGSELNKNNIFEIFSDSPEKEFTSENIQQRLDLAQSTVDKVLKILERQKKIIMVRFEKRHRSRQPIRFFKLVLSTKK